MRTTACSLDLSFGNKDLFHESSFGNSQEKSNSRNRYDLDKPHNGFFNDLNFLKVATPRFETKNTGLDNVDRMMNRTMHY